jgi:hypothetical protein
MVLSLQDAVAILSKWKDDAAHILELSESPFQQSRRGILEQDIDWSIGLQEEKTRNGILSTLRRHLLNSFNGLRRHEMCKHGAGREYTMAFVNQ